MEQARLIRMMERADWMLAAELALIGSFVNVPERLAHRQRIYKEYADRGDLVRRYHSKKYRGMGSSRFRLVRVLTGIEFAAPLSASQRIACMEAIAGFGIIH